MAIKKFKPTSPSLRKMTVMTSEGLSENKPLKSLTAKKANKAGRNTHGRITVRRRGGGVKQRYRIIDFKRDKIDIPATVKTIEYDPNRTCHIALLSYKDGEKRYILAPQGLKVGDEVISSDGADIKVGNSKMLRDIPVGTLVHNIELYPQSGGQLSRSAGAYAQLMAKEGREALLRLPLAN